MRNRRAFLVSHSHFTCGRMNRILMASLGFWIVSSLSSVWLNAQTIDPGNRIQIVVRARVSRDSAHRLMYSYSVNSLPQSQQTVQEFRIIFRPSNDSISQGRTALGWDSPGIPSGMGDPFNYIIWWAPIPNQIQHGDSTNGFSYTTTQLPGICEYFAEGNHALPWFPEGMAEDSIPGYDDLTPYGPGIVGKTVGAVKTLSTVGLLSLLDSLNSYIRQARSFRWIVNQPTSDKYTNYLSTVRAHLQAGENGYAIRTLQHVLKSADSDSSSVLASEAYALIRYNTEYLVSNLKAIKR